MGIVVGMVGTIDIDIQHDVAGCIAKANSQEAKFVGVKFEKFAFSEWILAICPPVRFGNIIGGDEIKADVEKFSQLEQVGGTYHSC